MLDDLHQCYIPYKNHLCTLHISGESTRKGFYVYDQNRKAGPNPELKSYIEKARSTSGISVDPKVSFSPMSPHKTYVRSLLLI